MSMKSIVLTGATSLIGLALIRNYCNEYEIHALVRPGSSRSKIIGNYPNVDVHEYELKDIRQSAGEIGEADYFIHLGWDSSFENSRYNDEGQERNVTTTMESAMLADSLSCESFIGMGSQAECGRITTKISERTPSKPENAYGRAKEKAVIQSTIYCEEHGMKCIWPRLLSAYGPFDRKHTLLMSCISAWLDKRTINLTKCEQIWDYIYVDDVADATVRIMKKGKHGVRYPIASGNGRPLYEYLDILKELTNCPDELLKMGGRDYSEDQVMNLVGDISSLRRDTGFVPKTTFNEGIQKTIDWVISGGEEVGDSGHPLLQ